jgi:cation:H+ antiporter
MASELGMTVHVGTIVLAALGIFVFSHLLSTGTNAIGQRYRINPGVRGATLDAVASSFPELCAVLVALYAGAFEAGVGTIAGSALYNILVIPAVSVVVGGPLQVQKAVVRRDGFLYVAVVVGLILAAWFGPETRSPAEVTHRLSWGVGLAGLLIYVAYVVVLALQARTSTPLRPAEGNGKDASFRLGNVVLLVAIGIAGIGLATHFLVHASLELFRAFGLSEAIAGVTLLAAATSLPDTLLSVFAARRGHADGAVANAFGSNSFDILICLGLPILVVGGVEVNWAESWRILVFLLASTLASVLFLITDWRLTRREAAAMGGAYALFLTLAIAGFL